MNFHLWGALFLTSTASSAIAQSDASVIVVTAPGGRIDSDDAETIGAEAINAGARADLAAALLREAPGVTLGEAQGNPWQAGISWHGYGASALQGTEQGLAVYLDGVRFNQPFGDTLLLDLLPEAALVSAELREASPLYGRNALGGALLLGTGRGRDLPGVRASLHGDSIGGYGGSVSLGWTDGASDALLIGEALHDPGWRDASPSTLYRLFGEAGHEGEGWGVTTRVIAADTRLTGNAVSPVELLDADYSAIFTSPDAARARYLRLIAQPWVQLGETTRLEGSFSAQWLKRDSDGGDLADFEECEEDEGLLCLEHEEEEGEDDGEEEEFDILRDSNGMAIAVDPDVDDYAVNNRSHERTRTLVAGLQLLDERETEAGTLRLALGFAYEHANTDFQTESELGVLEEDRSVTSLGTVLTSDSGAITPVDLTARLSDLALYASAEVPLTSTLKLEAGLRWAENRVRLIDRIGTALNGKHRFSRLNPSIELDFEPGEGVELHAGYAETNRAPTPVELSCADPDAPCALASFFLSDPPLKQVVARHYEAGARGRTGALNWHLGLWRADSSDEIRQIASEVRGRAYFVNGGDTRRQGVELGGEWQRGGWRIAANYAFTDARFRTDFTVASPANPAADEDDGTIEVAAGDRLPGLPRHSASLSADYAAKGWSIGATLRAQSDQVLAGDEGNDTPPLPGFAVADIRARVTLAPGIELTGELRNLFNRRYYSFGTFSEVDEIELAEAPGASNPRAYAPGAPRRLTVSVSAKF